MRQNHTLLLGLLEFFQNDAEPLGKFKFWKSLKLLPQHNAIAIRVID